MNGKKAQFLNVIRSAERMIIPVYQRNYDWKIEQCRQLFDDLVDIIRDKHEHFFGSVVSVEIDQNSSRLIIDGQQRIATISIMLIAIRNLIKDDNILMRDKKLSARIFLHYLYDDEAVDDKRSKLQLIKQDQKAFQRLFDTGVEFIAESNVTRNYEYFYEQFRQLDVAADDIFNAIKMLSIIDITLDSKSDDPQKIFESLNSTGLDLNEGDKIRNFILMNMAPEQQEQLYNDYWHRIEELTKTADTYNYDVSSFVRDYLTIKTNKIPKKDEVYAAFKAYSIRSALGAEECLSDLLKYATYYNEINSARTSSKRVNDILRLFNVLEMSICMPYLLALCNFRAEQKISEDDFFKVFQLIDSYIFRRIICEVPSRALDRVFQTLHRDALKLDTGYVDAVSHQLIIKTRTARFPTDDEFSEQIIERNVFGMNPKAKVYLFARLENGISPNGADILDRLIDKTYIIDRIMPQRLSLNWKRELGANADIIHSIWINRLANATVIEAGTIKSAASFKDKKFAQTGFHNSALQLNRDIAQYQRWTNDELQARSLVLAELTINLWAYPESNYKPAVKENEIRTLDDDIDFTGRSVLSYSFRGEHCDVKNWTDMYVQILKTFYTLDSAQLYQFAKNKPTFAPSPFVNGIKIGKKLYIHTITDTNKKLKTLRDLFNFFKIDKDELEIELRPAVN